MSKHAGIVQVPEKLVLDWLGFHGGRLKFFGFSQDYNEPVAVIEHPDMPEVPEGDQVPMVMASYRKEVTPMFDLVVRCEPKHKFWSKVRLVLRLVELAWTSG